MLETAILLLSLSVSFVLLRLASGSASIRYINGINYVFYRQIIIGALLGSYLISLSLEYDRWYALDWSGDVRFYGFLLVNYSMIMVLLVYLLLKLFFLQAGSNTLVLGVRPTRFNFNIIQNILFIFSVYGFLYLFLYSPSWPLLDVIRGDYERGLIGRIAFRNDFEGSSYIKNIVAFGSSSLYFYVSLAAFLISKTGLRHLASSFLLVFLIYTFSSQKGAILNVAIGALIVVCILRGKIPRGIFFLLAFLGCFSIYLLFSFVKGIPLVRLFESQLIVGRLFLGNIEGFFNSLELFPHVITDDTQLVGVPSFIQEALFGVVQKPSKLLLMEYFDYQGVLEGTSGFITAYYLAEAWANYGLFGMMLAPVVVAVNFFLVDWALMKFGKNPLTVSLYAVMYLQFQLHGEFIGFLYFKYFAYVLVLCVPVLFIYYLFVLSSARRLYGGDG